jgi:hypothetical protein
MSNNPILDLFYHDDRTLKNRITKADLDRFYQEYVVPNETTIMDIVKSNNAETEKLGSPQPYSRNNLEHLWSGHLNGYTPLGDLVFMSDLECDHLHVPILHQAYNFLCHGMNPEVGVPSSIIENGYFLAMALLYEVLPHVGKRLKSEITPEEFINEITKTFVDFQKRLAPFNPSEFQTDQNGVDLSGLNDIGFRALSNMNVSVFASGARTAPDDPLVHSTFQFGSQNEGDDVKAIQLLEGVFRAVINDIPLEKDQLQSTRDDLFKYFAYGGSYGLSSIPDKIALFVSGVEAATLVREILKEQHKLMHGGTGFSEEIAKRSNEFFDFENFLNDLYSPER